VSSEGGGGGAKRLGGAATTRAGNTKILSVALSAWRSGGGGVVIGGGNCSRSVYGAIARYTFSKVSLLLNLLLKLSIEMILSIFFRRECAGMSVRPCAGSLLHSVTRQLRPMEWGCVHGGVGGVGNAVGGEMSGVCVAECCGVVVAAGRCGVSVM